MWTTTWLYPKLHPVAGGILQLTSGLPESKKFEIEYSLTDAEIFYGYSQREDFQGHYPYAHYTKTRPVDAVKAERITRFISFKNGIQVGYLFDRDFHARSF